MRIYVDMDDVLCETAVALCGMAEREFGRRVAYENVRDFDLQKVFSLSDAEMDRFREISHMRDTLASFTETVGAVAGVRSLAEAGHEVEIVTGRPPISHPGTSDWLKAAGLEDLPVLYVDKYDRADVFARRPGDPPLVRFEDLEARGYDVAIDDSPLALRRLAGWRNTRVLVFSRPWNQSFDLAPNMRRIGGWPDLLARFADGLV